MKKKMGNYSAGACLAPSPIGGGLGWGQVLKNFLHRACPHPNLPPEGEGVGELNSYLR